MTARLFECELDVIDARAFLEFAIEAEHDAAMDLEEAKARVVEARAKREKATQALNDALDATDAGTATR